jgi:hypothetical protein
VLNGSRVRASPSISRGFTLAMISSLGFGSENITLDALLTLDFSTPPGHNPLDKVIRSTRWFVLQKVRGHPYGLPLFVSVMVSGSISPGSPPYFSPFPHGTGSLLVRLSIQPWPVSLACFPQSSLSPWYLRKISRSVKLFSFTGLLPSLVALSRDIQLTKPYLSALPQKFLS